VTDPELVEKKLAEIDTYLRELRALADPARIRSDVKEERFVAHTLQLAIQAALDAASHIVSDERLGEPTTCSPFLGRSGYGSAPALERYRRPCAACTNCWALHLWLESAPDFPGRPHQDRSMDYRPLDQVFKRGYRRRRRGRARPPDRRRQRKQLREPLRQGDFRPNTVPVHLIFRHT